MKRSPKILSILFCLMGGALLVPAQEQKTDSTNGVQAVQAKSTQKEQEKQSPWSFPGFGQPTTKKDGEASNDDSQKKNESHFGFNQFGIFGRINDNPFDLFSPRSGNPFGGSRSFGESVFGQSFGGIPMIGGNPGFGGFGWGESVFGGNPFGGLFGMGQPGGGFGGMFGQPGGGFGGMFGQPGGGFGGMFGQPGGAFGGGPGMGQPGGAFGGGPGMGQPGGGFGGMFGQPGGGFGGGPAGSMGHSPRTEKKSNQMSFLKMIPEDERERLAGLYQTDQEKFRSELEKLLKNRREQEFEKVLELRKKYLETKDQNEKTAIKKQLRELISIRYLTSHQSAERQIQETEEQIKKAQERLSMLRNAQKERARFADIMIDGTVNDYLNPDKEPVRDPAVFQQFERGIERTDDRNARSNEGERDRRNGERPMPFPK